MRWKMNGNCSNIETILNYKITCGRIEECVNQIFHWLNTEQNAKYLVCANPHSLEVARKDGIFRESIRNSDMVVPDGAGIILASRLLGGSIRQRVTGSDIFLELSRMLDSEGGYRYFFLGSSEETLARIRNKLQIDFPNITFAGSFSPPFKNEFGVSETDEMIEAVNKAKPDVLWVGMTAPKQEKWVYRHKDRLDVKFVGAVGAVFDFYTGNVKRSHPMFQKLGMEWLPRLLKQPKRLYKRTFVSAPKFVARILMERLDLEIGGRRREA